MAENTSKDRYKIKETFTMSVEKINMYAIMFLFPLLLFFSLPYVLIWSFDVFKTGFSDFIGWKLLPVILGGILIHEGLHGLALVILTKGKNRVIFGFNKELLAPYAHFKGPVRAWQYMIISALPGVVLGLYPLIYSLINGNTYFHFFGLLFTWSAAGDLFSIIAISRYPFQTIVRDHPDTLGFYVLEENTE
ncbi:MAG TPA: DUF3267 domain-containing protein [Bacteroidales bacterium]|nr:DUF3267 domain-containing protein [Bacteroidales bacterium]